MPSKICGKTHGRVEICCPFCLERFGKLATHLKDEKSPCAKTMKDRKFTRKEVLTARRESIRNFGVYHLDIREYERLWKEPDPVLALCETLQLPISDTLKSASRQLKNKPLMPFIRIPKLSGQTPVDLRHNHISCNCRHNHISCNSNESGNSTVQKATNEPMPSHLKPAVSLATRSLEKRRLSRSKSGRKWIVAHKRVFFQIAIYGIE